MNDKKSENYGYQPKEKKPSIPKGVKPGTENLKDGYQPPEGTGENPTNPPPTKP